MDPSSATGDGESLTIEGPEIAAWAELLQPAVGSELLHATLATRCRSCRGLDAVLNGTHLSAVFSRGRRLHMRFADRILVISFNESTIMSETPCAVSQRKALDITLSDVMLSISDARKFVYAIVLDGRDAARVEASVDPIPSSFASGAGVAARLIHEARDGETIAEMLRRDEPISGLGPELIERALHASRVSPWRRATDVTSRELGAMLVESHAQWRLRQHVMITAPRTRLLPAVPWSQHRASLIGDDVIRERVARGLVISWDRAVQR